MSIYNKLVIYIFNKSIILLSEFHDFIEIVRSNIPIKCQSFNILFDIFFHSISLIFSYFSITFCFLIHLKEALSTNRSSFLSI